MLRQCSATFFFFFFFLPTARPTLTLAREGAPQNFALRKKGYKTIRGHKNVGPVCTLLSYID
jgi:hypothetical protein